MVNEENMAVLILAAGQSSRMGKIKQLLPWKNTTLLGNAIINAKTISENVFVVLGAFSNEIKNEFGLKEALFIENKNWENGLGSSLAFGIDYIQKSQKDYRAILVTLGDQPLIDGLYLKTIVTSHNDTKKGIIATAYGGRAGVPALFASNYFDRLRKLDSDNGAKTIINSNKNDTLILSPNGKAMDVDTLEDYKKVLNS
ncbi:nucleotidyltransferase family protein [Kriegella aquimaris]|uniref:Molybdenum cofactor cytidylyltransferase n=1 Tax=Kriegella aquimaris TaxID=192904 RepID=A0A1G9ISZ8_9FLAO|nr:nucleotidyltransferase family protein [Kriegella aquimaris]SDL27914.1 molybdenum cofactor cytidylyltransferase [Kriegella aquimaris]